MKDILTNSDHELKKSQEWIEYIKHKGIRYLKTWEHSDKGFIHFSETENLSDVQSPANIAVTDKYAVFAKKSATSCKYPVSITEGMQTIINLCRVASGYDPLDPEGNGNAEKFIAFTDEIERVPFLSLLWSDTKIIIQKSQDTDVLIDSFVKAFRGLSPEDKITIKLYLKELIRAALSYAGEKEKQSNFVQYALNKSPNSVSLLLYSSVLTIKKVNNKGTIKFTSNYTLSQAEYNLNQASWETVRPMFDKENKITIEYLIDYMTTKVKK
ncbi:hypothetical protein Ppb6_03660 [Photorhabdus australis subsp. thailandensis]|uniref:Uncharacterized protein n=1 Tax=Photorhabdus australis subsp. thailandensis TaxID=2805096 RepID=A0A1C0TZK1_9GAMM|nr:hypothetical protein [Photorhabdus australis]OCQ51102.1 hypothetical protein Ppb6_03660 [Photorhabdus australis subsp. thailandensis]